MNHALQTTIRQYKVLAQIASGGMGAVYLGALSQNDGLRDLIAIKMIHEHLAEKPAFVEMLLDEARVASRIVHPNVVRIRAVGSFSGRHFLVMTYIEGGTLGELIKSHRSRMPIAIVIRAMLDTLRGLHAAHTTTDENGKPLGLVHRDLSPGNILIGTDGITRVIDFGIAKTASRIERTAPGTVKGKLSYMAPEQASGGQLDHRADVFSAGVVLWTALTGMPLFTGNSDAHTLANLLTTTAERPSQINRSIPRQLDFVCARALERQPARRFQSASEMAQALEAAASAAGVLASHHDVYQWMHEAYGNQIQHRRILIGQLKKRAQSLSDFRRGFSPSVAELDTHGSRNRPAQTGKTPVKVESRHLASSVSKQSAPRASFSLSSAINGAGFVAAVPLAARTDSHAAIRRQTRPWRPWRRWFRAALPVGAVALAGMAAFAMAAGSPANLAGSGHNADGITALATAIAVKSDAGTNATAARGSGSKISPVVTTATSSHEASRAPTAVGAADYLFSENSPSNGPCTGGMALDAVAEDIAARSASDRARRTRRSRTRRNDSARKRNSRSSRRRKNRKSDSTPFAFGLNDG
ncbi:MAG: serine/threonine protein kinase [Proteobacteria bacterium]|nr:serine/threonine protein kinase [Pseudomonadota bacterium]